MNILHLSASYKPAEVYGGPVFSISALCEALARDREEPEVFTTTANGKKELPLNNGAQMVVDGVPVTYFNRITKDHTHLSPQLIAAFRRKITGPQRPDVVHIHAWWNLVSVITAYLAIKKKQKVVLSPRGTLSRYSFMNRHSLLKKWIFSLCRNTLQKCHVHATSIYEAEQIGLLFTPKSISTIPNIVELPGVLPLRESETTARLRLLFLSRIEEKKGLELLLNTLGKTGFPYQLTIAGTGSEKYMATLKKHADALGIGHHIQWIGQQSGSAKYQVMQHHDLLVLPSYDENFANVVVESLAMGTAVLLSDQVGLSDYVAENRLGWVSAANEKDLAEMLSLVNESRLVLARIRERAPAMVRADFAREKLVALYRAFYQEVLAAN